MREFAIAMSLMIDVDEPATLTARARGARRQPSGNWNVAALMGPATDRVADGPPVEPTAAAGPSAPAPGAAARSLRVPFLGSRRTLLINGAFVTGMVPGSMPN